MAEASRKLVIDKSDRKTLRSVPDSVAVEEPLEIQIVSGTASGAAPIGATPEAGPTQRS